MQSNWLISQTPLTFSSCGLPEHFRNWEHDTSFRTVEPGSTRGIQAVENSAKNAAAEPALFYQGDDGAVTGSAVFRRICLINPAGFQLLVRCEMSYGKYEGRSIADFPGVGADGAYPTGGACGELVSATCRAELKLGVTLTNQPP